MLRNWNSHALLVGMWNSIVAMMRTVWQFLKKLNIEQLCALAILLLGIYPKEFKARTQISVHNVPEIWFTIARVQTTYMPINRWVNKMWYIYIYIYTTYIYISHFYIYIYIYIWSGLPFPSPGDLPDPGIIPWSPSLQADALPSEPPGK